jgi:hypothetical protein
MITVVVLMVFLEFLKVDQEQDIDDNRAMFSVELLCECDSEVVRLGKVFLDKTAKCLVNGAEPDATVHRFHFKQLFDMITTYS